MTLKKGITEAMTQAEAERLATDLDELAGMLLDSRTRFLVTRMENALCERATDQNQEP